MKTEALILLPITSAGSDVIGNPQKAAAYYARNKTKQTISWYFTMFTGDISVEATVDADNSTDNYFEIHNISETGAVTLNDFIIIDGSYTWVRVSVTNFSAGTINKIVMSY